MLFKNLCILVLWMKIAIALEGLRKLPAINLGSVVISVGYYRFLLTSLQLATHEFA